MNQEGRSDCAARHTFFWLLLDLMLIIGAVFLFRLYSYFTYQQNNLSPLRTLEVEGEGKSIAIPDIAVFNFSVINEGADVKKISADNAQKMNASIAFLKERGVAEKDIKTTGFNLSPKYVYEPRSGKSRIDGYTLTNSATVKIRDFSMLSDVFDGLLQLQVDQIGSVSFDVDDKEKHLDEARKAAFENARKKAEKLANINGVKLKRIVTFTESAGVPPVPPPIFFAAERAAAPIETSIERGSQEISVTARITYEIE